MKRTICLLILGLVIASFGFSQIDIQPVAIVRLTTSEPITVKQFRTEVEKFEAQAGRPLTTAERREVLDGMIDEKLVLQAATRDRITITDNELNQQMQELRNILHQQLGRAPTEAEFAQAVRNEYSLELPAFREQVRKQLILQKYIMEKKRPLLESITQPQESEINGAFMRYSSQLVRPNTVRFKIINVPFTDAVSKVRAKGIIDRLYAEIGGNAAKFDEVSLRSQAPNADFQAGDGGYLPYNEIALEAMGIDFLNIAFALRQGEVSRIIEGRQGFQIIKVTETYSRKILELDDILDLASGTTVRNYLGQMLLAQRQQAVLDQATQEIITELRRGNPFQIIEANINW